MRHAKSVPITIGVAKNFCVDWDPKNIFQVKVFRPVRLEIPAPAKTVVLLNETHSRYP
jgi:hypothetical protein